MSCGSVASGVRVHEATMDIAKLAAFVFASPLPPAATIDIVIEGVDGSKGLFCYFLDLLVRGMFVLFGDADGNVRLDLMTSDDKERLFRAMRRINVDVHLEPTTDGESGAPLIDVSPARDAPEGLPLEAYHARLRLASGIYDIRFRHLGPQRRPP